MIVFVLRCNQLLLLPLKQAPAPLSERANLEHARQGSCGVASQNTLFETSLESTHESGRALWPEDFPLFVQGLPSETQIHSDSSI